MKQRFIKFKDVLINHIGLKHTLQKSVADPRLPMPADQGASHVVEANNPADGCCACTVAHVFDADDKKKLTKICFRSPCDACAAEQCRLPIG